MNHLIAVAFYYAPNGQFGALTWTILYMQQHLAYIHATGILILYFNSGIQMCSIIEE